MKKYRVAYVKGLPKYDVEILEKLKEVQMIWGIPAEIQEIKDAFVEEELYEEIKRNWRRIKKASMGLLKKGVKICLETPGRKFKTRRGYLTLGGTLLIYDENGLLWAGASWEVNPFLEKLIAEGKQLLEEISAEASKKSPLKNLHTDVMLNYLEGRKGELRNCAVLVEYPVGAARMGMTCSELIKEASRREYRSYLEERYAKSAIEVWGTVFLMKADLVLVKGPKRLKAGTIYVPPEKSRGVKREVIINLKKFCDKNGFGLSCYGNPFYMPRLASQLEGEEIRVVEIKSSANTQDLKNALGQVILYSLLIALDLESIGARVPEIKTEIAYPKGEIVNPLVRSVADMINVKMIQV